MYTISKILDMYFNEYKSIKVIADECGTYPQKIRRAIIKTGRQLRDKSEAQKEALSSGRHGHPTKGKKHREDSKDKIGQSVVQSWANLTNEELQHRSQIGKDAWDKKTVNEKAEFKRLAQQNLHIAAKEGSKLEKFLKNKLIENGYDITFHQKHLLENEKLHIDIMVNNLSTAIEIDGPTHTNPIWGHELLNKTRRADSQKTGLLINAGFKVIRIKYNKSISKQYKKTIWNKLNNILQNIGQAQSLTILEV